MNKQLLYLLYKYKKIIYRIKTSKLIRNYKAIVAYNKAIIFKGNKAIIMDIERCYVEKPLFVVIKINDFEWLYLYCENVGYYNNDLSISDAINIVNKIKGKNVKIEFEYNKILSKQKKDNNNIISDRRIL